MSRMKTRPLAFPESFIIYDEFSSPSADDYIIDADHSTMRLSTGYPVETHLLKIQLRAK
jgi:hypothetical protein